MRPERALLRLVIIVMRRVGREQAKKQKQKSNEDIQDQNNEQK